MAKKPTEIQIENAEKLLKQAGHILPRQWHRDDITNRAIETDNLELTESEVDEIIDQLESDFDASEGINWSTIDNAISYVKPNQ